MFTNQSDVDVWHIGPSTKPWYVAMLHAMSCLTWAQRHSQDYGLKGAGMALPSVGPII